jgi:hypothetical protein
MNIKFTTGVLLIILSELSFAQYAKNSSALSNIALVNNPNIETSVEFKGYGSSDEIPWVGEYGITETVADIMEREKNNPTIFNGVLEPREEFESPRADLPPTPGFEVSQWPHSDIPFYPPVEPMNPQTVGVSFLGTQISEGPGYIPPDCMGDVGPTQIMVAANGRIKVFDKTGVLGALNSDMDVFFNSVRNGSGTSDPHIRFDRLSQRWFVVIINVASTNNRVLLAVSSGPTITGSSSFTFFFFQHDLVSPAGDNGEFADYPTLGVDVNALYIGVNNFLSNSFNSCTGFVVRKSSILGAGPIFATAFRDLCTTSITGPYTPQGVDNDDPSSTQGYFIGVDAFTYNLLVVRRVSDPGGTPTISGNLNITVPVTYAPLSVPALGTSTSLDALDDRLFAAQIRKNKITSTSSLWTAHNIRVNTGGVGGSTGTRNACRWYEITNLSTTPTLNQSGTLFDAATSNPQFFWIPSVAMSGQGHMSLGSSRAGVGRRAEIVVAGRLSSDALGTTQSFTLAQTSTTAYNVTVTNPQRWGDYSQVGIDPNDDMTMWTFQEYCNTTNSWGVRVVQLKAPPPVTPTTATPNAIAPNQTSVNVVITGTVVNGSGFFDPGTGFPNHISASLSGGIVVNSTTFNSQTQVTLNLNTTGAPDGFYTVTITNPDGQSAISATGILQIDHNLPVELSSFTAKVLKSGGVKLDWRTETEVSNYGFEVQRAEGNYEFRISNFEIIGFVEGHGNSNSPKDYSFTDNSAGYGKYSYRLKQIDTDGQFEYSKVIEVDAGNIPNGFVLEQNYPNPFNPSTTIKFALAETQQAQLKVYDILGNEIVTLFNDIAEGGKVYEVEFNSHSVSDLSFRLARNLSSGIYFYRLETKSRTENRKMLLLK